MINDDSNLSGVIADCWLKTQLSSHQSPVIVSAHSIFSRVYSSLVSE